jgi:membrane protein
VVVAAAEAREVSAREFERRLRRALVGVYENGALGFAKGAAYSALLAFFPILTPLTTVLIRANAEAVSRKIAGFVFEVAPPGTEELIRYQFMERGARPVTLPVLATILSLWAASGVMMSLLDGFRAARKRKDPRGVIVKRLVAVALVVISALPVVGASSLMIFGDRAERTLLSSIGLLEAGQALAGPVEWLGKALRYLLAFGATVLVTGLLYWLGPQPRCRCRSVWSGAWLATILWLAVTLLFAWYVRNIASYNLLYGSIGAAIALLVWMFLLAVIALLGFEFVCAGERR